MAMTKRTRMVKSSGRRLRLLSTHSCLNSLLWFFFITIALRKGAMMMTVRMPVMALAYQWSSHPGNNLRINGRTMENITAIEAAESIE